MRDCTAIHEALREDLRNRANNASELRGLDASLLIEAGQRQSADRVCRIVELVAEGGAGKTPKAAAQVVRAANVNIHAGEMEAAGMMAAE